MTVISLDELKTSRRNRRILLLLGFNRLISARFKIRSERRIKIIYISPSKAYIQSIFQALNFILLKSILDFFT